VEEFPTVTEVSENAQPATFDGVLDDIFGISLESLEDFTAAEVAEDIQPVAQGEALLDAIVDSSVIAKRCCKAQIASETDVGKIGEAENSLPTLELNNSTPAPCHALFSEFSIDVEAVANATSLTEEAVEESSSIEETITPAVVTSETKIDAYLEIGEESSPEVEELETTSSQSPITEEPETLAEAVQSLGEIFDELPPLECLPAQNCELTLTTSTAANLTLASEPASLVPAVPNSEQILPINQAVQPATPTRKEPKTSTDSRKGEASPASLLSVRVGSERLERMNNLVGELAINRNGLSLQNDQLQSSVRELLNRFSRVQTVVGNLQELSYQMLVTPERYHSDTLPHLVGQLGELMARQADFDSLELDNYGVLNSRLQELLEDMVQLEEAVDDIVLFAKQSDQTLEQQRQMLTQLRDELIWARMLPLGEVLNRFPRVLRDLSTRFHKSVNLKLSGTSVLVDKAVLEKLYDPLLHLLRNAFDHGIESPQERIQQGKPEQGQIEIRAYHQGSQTIIEVKDDGQGLDLDGIRAKALELGLLTEQVLPMTSTSQLYELIFEAGFSTSKQVSELSGRGVGLDVVRAQMRSLKGTISVTSSPGVGTTFTLRLPLTLTIAKLLVCFVGSTALALPSDGVEEIVIPKASQIKDSGRERFLQWRGQIVPAYRLSELLEYNCPLPDMSPSKALVSAPTPQDWALPMLVLCQDKHVLALEIDRLVTEQELVIKPFGSAIAPPSFTYGCTILGDGSLIPVIDGAVLLDQLLGHRAATTAVPAMKSLPANVSEAELLDTDLAAPSTELQASKLEIPSVSKTPIKTIKAPTVLVVDDAVALRRTLALTLERAGCQVLQARDGREAIEQLQRSASVKLVICDVEMPNMNGFEFLSHRRQDSQLSKIPVAMLTSRSNDKHRWLAMQLGATAYFTKPYLEQEFVAAIKELINQSTPESQLALLSTV
jgi:chemotaxis family two-component system sensor histidine kinase/response regulator PixL